MMPLGDILFDSIVVLSCGDTERALVDAPTTTLALNNIPIQEKRTQ